MTGGRLERLPMLFHVLATTPAKVSDERIAWVKVCRSACEPLAKSIVGRKNGERGTAHDLPSLVGSTLPVATDVGIKNPWESHGHGQRMVNDVAAVAYRAMALEESVEGVMGQLASSGGIRVEDVTVQRRPGDAAKDGDSGMEMRRASASRQLVDGVAISDVAVERELLQQRGERLFWSELEGEGEVKAGDTSERQRTHHLTQWHTELMCPCWECCCFDGCSEDGGGTVDAVRGETERGGGGGGSERHVERRQLQHARDEDGFVKFRSVGWLQGCLTAEGDDGGLVKLVLKHGQGGGGEPGECGVGVGDDVEALEGVALLDKVMQIVLEILHHTPLLLPQLPPGGHVVEVCALACGEQVACPRVKVTTQKVRPVPHL
mmetsp:Transcript_24973/g.58975  ORF Transcript_24973/g.58975 Transcript_24973/m.58975 type:complete len:377 (-) Transcript_24973:481-1611(-)